MAKRKDSKCFTESLTEFLSDPAGLSQEEIVSELQDQGIDTDDLEKRVMEIVKKGAEKRRLAWRETARRRREEIEKIFQSAQISSMPSNIMNKIKEILRGDFGPEAFSHAETFFRKKEGVSEKDLVSLIEDLEHLNLLEGTDKDKE
ncbi:MAG: hypothetical protein JRH18_23940 [Deltaproteobacteria bacterium]|nr:hypothetical protein [Deltaproteobacteria bacterium]MBW2154699.1 hypothetical protein [Deltaproteobacteria bacterium]